MHEKNARHIRFFFCKRLLWSGLSITLLPFVLLALFNCGGQLPLHELLCRLLLFHHLSGGEREVTKWRPEVNWLLDLHAKFRFRQPPTTEDSLLSLPAVGRLNFLFMSTNASSLSASRLFSVKSKVVLVTGGAKGIGNHITRAYLENGAKVYIAARERKVCGAFTAWWEPEFHFYFLWFILYLSVYIRYRHLRLRLTRSTLRLARIPVGAQLYLLLLI